MARKIKNSSKPITTTRTLRALPCRLKRLQEVKKSPNLKGTRHIKSIIVRRTTFHEIRRRRQSIMKTNANGQLTLKPGDVFVRRFKVIGELGAGSFGAVLNVNDLKRGSNVALKIAHGGSIIRRAAQQELDVLKVIKRKDPNSEHFCVRMLNHFEYHGHICIAFEKLGLSLFDFMRKNKGQPYPMDQLRHIAYQLCCSVKFLHDNRITHTDLKPENIAFVNSAYTLHYDAGAKRKIRRVKNTDIRLLDFGLATFDHQNHKKLINTDLFRAPEVILELGWSHPSDVWSIGCILFELRRGKPLFAIQNHSEHLALMEATLGPLPTKMKLQTKTGHFDKGGRLIWDEVATNNVIAQREPISYRETDSESELFDLVRKMLAYDPAKRIPLRQALKHPFLMKLPEEQRVKK